MISVGELRELLAWKPADGGKVLSLYLDRKTATGFWNGAHSGTLVKGIAKETGLEIDEAERERFDSAAAAALQALAAVDWNERSLAAFATADGKVRTAELNVPLVSQARWDAQPYLLPLIEALGEHERLAVVLADRKRARLFTIALGEIEEERDAFNPEPVKRVAATGSDQARTTNLQRRADQHAHRHLKHVAAMLDEMWRTRRFGRLVLGGATETANRLRDLLPKRLAESVAGLVHLPVDATKDEVLAATLDIERRAHEDSHEEAVDLLATASAKRERAAVGLDGTLDALREGRVRTLLYAEGIALRGRRCSSCGSLFDESADPCR